MKVHKVVVEAGQLDTTSSASRRLFASNVIQGRVLAMRSLLDEILIINRSLTLWRFMTYIDVLILYANVLNTISLTITQR